MKQSITTIRSSILIEFRRLALSLNLDPLALMQRAGIHPRYLEDADLILPMSAVNDLLEIAALTAGMDDFGLRLGEIRGVPDVGPVTLMLREQETLRAAIQTLIAYVHLHSDAAYIYLNEKDLPILMIDVMVDGAGSRRQTIDGSVASILNLLRWLIGDQWTPAQVCFMHSPPASMARFDRFFRCPIYFDREFNGIVLRMKDLDHKLPYSSVAMRRQIERYLQIVDSKSSGSYAHQVAQIISLALSHGEVKAEIIAGYLGVNTRTLHRRLAKVGLNYSALLEDVRKNTVMQHLHHGKLPLSDIAGMIGFGSVSAFSTWFRKSFECAPSVWRKARMRPNESARECIGFRAGFEEVAQHRSRDVRGSY